MNSLCICSSTVEIPVIYYLLYTFIFCSYFFVFCPCPPLCLMSFLPARIRTLAPKHISPCARTLVCSSLFSTSCFWRVSPSWVLQRTCATCGRRSRKNRVRQRPRSISSSKSLCVRTRAGPYRPTGGSTWWQASSRLLVVWRSPWKIHMYATFRSLFVHKQTGSPLLRTENSIKRLFFPWKRAYFIMLLFYYFILLNIYNLQKL